MQLYEDLETLSFVRIRRLNWIVEVNRINSYRKVSQVFNNNPQESRLRGRPNTDGGTVYRQISTDAKLRTGK